VEASRQAIAALSNISVPTEPLSGFVLWAAWGAGFVALAGDWLAIRCRSLSALLPAFLLFFTTCIIGTAAGRTWAVATFVAMTVVFALVRQWVDVGPSRALQYAGSLVMVIIGVSVSTALVLALGTDGSGLAGWGTLWRNPVRVTPNPLVSLQQDLLHEPRVPVFLVHSKVSSYWRLTSLAFFDGTSWSESGTYQAVRGRMPGVEKLAGARQVLETFRIEDLGSPWLPVAFQPESISGAVKASYDPLSGSLLTAGQTARGEVYQVVAAQDLALVTAALLGHVPKITTANRSALAQFLELPTDLPATVVRLAHRLMPGDLSEYQKTIALLKFFHQAPFVYTLQPPRPGGTGSLASFLFETHAGYCQQYAGSYAILARLAGLPARVAVGFSEGAEISPGTWQVLGSDAHAWPEVWFPRVGWVPFEPTPSYEIPGAQYAGLDYGVVSSAVGKSTSISFGARSPKSARPRTSVAAGGLPSGPSHKGHSSGLSPGRHRGRGAIGNLSSTRLATWVPGACIAAAVVFALALARRARFAKRRRAPKHLPGPDARPDLATYAGLVPLWEILSDRISQVGLDRRPSETPIEWATRSSDEMQRRGLLDSTGGCALVEMSELFTHVAYSSWCPAPQELYLVWEALARVRWLAVSAPPGVAANATRDERLADP
jgi:transglutaminase-like putative cysteine protease